MLPREYTRKFANAQYSAPPLSAPLVVKTIRELFGRRPIERDTLYNVIQDYSDVVFEEDKQFRGYQDAREEFEQQYFRHLIDTAGGNMSEAARLSGIPRQNLYVRMKRWGIVTD